MNSYSRVFAGMYACCANGFVARWLVQKSHRERWLGGRSEDGDQPTRGGKGLVLEGGTEVRALFISIDRKV